ncbi:MAG: asparagine synthase (glutamine-hydrolyzing) [Candidatus Methylomirabilales bacterium]
MCGICGKVNFDCQQAVDPELIGRMTVTLSHRGPDGDGVYAQGSVGLGHRRLAVIDLSENGRQPMPNEDGSLWIVYNGEIYNFLILREGLIRKGHAFRSKTDTEVILHLYEEHGPDCVQFLRGMFAFAIWDGRKQTLLLARDRLGQKPLFYYADREKFLFASEPKAILQDPQVKAEPDLEAIHHYLTYGYVPSPFSAFRGVRKLPPAHYLLLRDGLATTQRYWKLHYVPKIEISEGEACEGLLHHLREAVRLRLLSDVPLGAFLSGGIDSSTVVALMREVSPGGVKTFSIGFEAQEYNELPYARMVARRLETEHHEFIVRPDATTILPKLIWHYNEPFADSSAVPTYCLAQMTRDHVTVALNGDGGDENFAGYDRYVANQLACRYERLPASLRRLLKWGIGLLPRGHPKSLPYRAHRFFEAVSEEPRRRYARWITHFNENRRIGLYAADFAETMRPLDPLGLLMEQYAASDAADFVDATLDVDVGTYLPDDLLVKVDMATMAHALEARSPFVDHQLMEFVARLPSRFKLRGRTQKYLFKRAARGLLPPAVRRRRKMGFGVPIDRWLRHELREMSYDILLAHRAIGRGYFNKDEVQRLLDEHTQGKASWHYLLWNLLMLELWHRLFIDQSFIEQPRRAPL